MPRIGMRILKTSAAVFLCFMVYLLRGRKGIVFYSCLSVIWCIQADMDSSFKKAVQRTIGTAVGGVLGLVVILFNIYVLSGIRAYDFFKYLIIAAMIIPTIYITIVLKKPDASYFSCVVFLSIVVMHLDESPFLFVFNRVLDTMIGIVIGLIVNLCHLPRALNNDTLFVSGVDDVLLDETETIPSFTCVKLNQMIKDGMHFTVSTERTPASLIPIINRLRLNMPVIAMNGAVLYDLKENRYVKTQSLPYDITCKVTEFARSRGFNCFINAVLEDLLVIYHQKFTNEVEEDIYKRLHTSPYRNYLCHEFPDDIPCVYIMIVDKTDKTRCLVEEMALQEFASSLRTEHHTSDTYPGYSYIKIYDKAASKENMLEYLRPGAACTRVITLGTIDGRYDKLVPKNEPEKTTKIIEHLYAPVSFKNLFKRKKP